MNNIALSPSGQPYGALHSEWMHFDLLLGLAEDLLPVVSNPNARISPASKMKSLGKTPSQYNKRGEAVGLPDWTSKRSTAKQIEIWCAEPDYGICLQTRSVRALDIDVPDQVLSDEIRDAFLRELSLHALPARIRENSGKQLLAFTLPGDLSKRSFKVEGGLVELLATGQQCIVAGAHPSGARYEWAGGLPEAFPEISLEAFEAAWAALVKQFAIEPQRGGMVTGPRPTGDLVEDEVADWLEANWETYGRHQGKLFVACPWKSGHSCDSGETETVWLVKQQGQSGMFKCLHASCEDRTREEFMQATGYTASGFEVLPEDDTPKARPKYLGVNLKTGEIPASAENLAMALESPAYTGMEFRFDHFLDNIIVVEDGGTPRAITKDDTFELMRRLERLGFKSAHDRLVGMAIHHRAAMFGYDSAIAWATSLVWDGVARIDTFLPTYLGTQDDAYTRACGAYLWTSLAGRALVPGVQADAALILVGAQGAGKTSAVAAMAPSPDRFAEISFSDPEALNLRKMRGTLVGELAELNGLKTRQIESIKAFMTRRVEHADKKYIEHASRYRRRCVLIGTTNDDEFLADETGARRFLPVAVGDADVPGITRDRDQLWAEGVLRFRATGEVAWREAQALAEPARRAHAVRDGWEKRVKAWLEGEDIGGLRNGDDPELALIDVAAGALQVPAAAFNQQTSIRLGRVMKALGYRNRDVKIGGKGLKRWVKEENP